MGIFDFFKRKKKSQCIEREPNMSTECEVLSIQVPLEKVACPTSRPVTVLPVSGAPSSGSSSQGFEKGFEEEKASEPLSDEYIGFCSKLYSVWSDKFAKRKSYNYENEIIEELYDVGFLSALDLRRLLREDKEETEKLILFYTENEPTEENIDFYEEFMIRHKLYKRVEVTDKTYNTLCRYISSCYDERPRGNALWGELKVYSLSYDQYLKLKPAMEKEISMIMDDTIEEEVKCRVMHEIRFAMRGYLTTKKCEYMI